MSAASVESIRKRSSSEFRWIMDLFKDSNFQITFSKIHSIRAKNKRLVESERKRLQKERLLVKISSKQFPGLGVGLRLKSCKIRLTHFGQVKVLRPKEHGLLLDDLFQ